MAPPQIQNVPLFETSSGLAAKTKQHADLQKQRERPISKGTAKFSGAAGENG